MANKRFVILVWIMGEILIACLTAEVSRVV